jgi:hypothetical protein
VTIAGFTVMTLRQGNNPPMEKPRLNKTKKAREKIKIKRMLIVFFDIKGIAEKEFILAAQTVNSTYYSDVLW